MAARPAGQGIGLGRRAKHESFADGLGKGIGVAGGMRQPVRSWGRTAGGDSTVSGTAPRSETTTGVPMAWASTAERPNASGSVEGTVTTEAARKAAGMSVQWPTRRTIPCSFRVAIRLIELADVGIPPLRIAGKDEGDVGQAGIAQPWPPPRPELSGPSSPSAGRRAARSVSCGATSQALRRASTRSGRDRSGREDGKIRAAMDHADPLAGLRIDRADQIRRCSAELAMTTSPRAMTEL